MILYQVGLVSLSLFFNLWALQAQAFNCVPPDFLIEEIGEKASTEAEILRHRSIGISNRIAAHLDGDIIVVGRFSRNAPTPFLHEVQLEKIRAKYWPPSQDVQMPYQIEYYYPGAYSFDGRMLENATLVPFSTEVIDARITITADYEGVIDLLPATEINVIGVIRSSFGGRRLELTTSICPSYYRIDAEQLSDLLGCYRDGLCR